MSTIICEIGFVFGCFFLVGLELGAVEVRTLVNRSSGVTTNKAAVIITIKKGARNC
jgi:hypothetical protein